MKECRGSKRDGLFVSFIAAYWVCFLCPAPAAAKSFQSYPTLSNLMDCSLPGSSVHGIFQARVLEWGAMSYIGLNSMSDYPHKGISL